MNIKNCVASLLTIALLSSCAALEKQSVTDKSLQDKAALAIGTKSENIKVSNIGGNIQSVTFDAVANGFNYSCYYTTALVVKSDAICTKFDELNNKPKSECNALTAAAGQCK